MPELIALVLLLACCPWIHAAPTPFCEELLPPGYSGLGGAVSIDTDCLWRPQVHFVASLTGRRSDQTGTLRVPVITFVPGELPTSSSGPNRLVVSDVVLANFSLSDPAADPGQVLWPVGLLQPGMQAGTTTLRRLYLQDVQMLVNAATLQQYLRFFRSSNTLVYTDNVTFLHIPYWADDETLINQVGLLLEVPGMSAADMAGSKPAPGRNFVVACDQASLVPLLQSAAASSTALPLLVYLSTNVSLGPAQDIAAGLPLNRHVYFVGRVTVPTSIDFGMEVNQLVLLGSWSAVTFSQLVLENLAPGDARSLPTSAPFDVLMGYHIWALLYPRSVRRAAVHNCTLVLSPLEVEEYLYKATLFKVQPAGFEQSLTLMNSVIQRWDVTWLPPSESVATFEYQSTAMTVLDCNYTSVPVVAPRMPLPARANDSSLTTIGSTLDQSLSHVDTAGVTDVGAGANSPGTSEMVLLSTNLSFGTNLPKNPVAELALQQHMQGHLQQDPGVRHTLMGIVDPSVTLDMGYSQDLAVLPPNSPPGHVCIINVVALRLSQGPAAAQPDATIMTPEVWTHLLWSIPRPLQTASVWLSNVTLWVPAAEFSYIRSRTSEVATNFSIDLTGGLAMRFYNVLDQKAEGLYIQRYSGPGLEADSLRIRLEAGWSQDGPPNGFWNQAQLEQPRTGKLSDTVVVVLAVCLVIAVVASVLSVLAFILWRKRTAEARASAQLAAAAEMGKAGLPGGVSNVSGGSGHHTGSGMQPAAANGSQLQGMAASLLDAPVHDSSDSYPLQDRAVLTAELARSQFGVNRTSHEDESGVDWDVRKGLRGGRLLPPAAAGAMPSCASMASDAALQRLHSAITTMSHDVLSRRLQVSSSNLMAGTPTAGAAAGATPALGRPSPPGAGVGGGEGSPHAQAQQQQQQRQEAGGHASGSHVHTAGSSQSLAGLDAAGVAAAGAAADQDEQLAGSAGGMAAAAAAAAVGPLQQNKAACRVSDSSSLATTSTSSTLGELKLLQLVGQGTFGQVYKALWRRRCVAVKVLQLPATAGSSDASPWLGVGLVSSHREKMAVMETVVSTTMSHPNIVQVYTYVLQPLMSRQGGMSSSGGKQRDANGGMGRLDGEQPQLQQQQREQRPTDQADQPEEQQQQQGQQQQQQQVSVQIPPDAAVDGVLPSSPSAQQQLDLPSIQGSPQGKSIGSQPSGSRLVNCNDSSQSLAAVQQLGKLTPEMAAAAAAALPAAAAAAAAAAGGSLAGGRAGTTTSSDLDGGGSGGSGDGPRGSVLVGWELRLVMEFCDAGSLRTALDHKLLIDRTTGLPALECVLFLAHDVACAMIHLHSEHLLHGDLKASNVLLKRTAPRLPVAPEQGVGGGASRHAGQLVGLGLGLMAKVADFGLSLTLGPADTHVSQMHMGTLTHMAPELLLHGHASKASDVYAYGILLWELATGRRPYSGTPVGMLAHKVAQQGWRPAWPGGCCQPLQALAEACWTQEAAARPCFEAVVQQLEDLASQLDSLKAQQAQQMAAAAAPFCHPGHSGHAELEVGHELTPSMMEDLMPSGFSGGSEHSGGAQAADSGTLYEMSQLSGCSQDHEAQAQLVQQLSQQQQ